MGKQTGKKGSHFGGDWTKQKLAILDKYLNFYTTALKYVKVNNIKVKKIYIDAFAGSGKVELKSGEILEGSAPIALRYDFDEYYFFEIDKERATNLQKIIYDQYFDKISKIKIINGDSNKELLKIIREMNIYKRSVLFLDPYAMELKWDVLNETIKSGVIDIWYLFPLSAVTRNLPNDYNKITESARRITELLGTDEWKSEIYHEKHQKSLFGNIEVQRDNFDKVVSFLINTFKKSFPYVSDKSRILRNKNNSPLFLLLFMMTNCSGKAIGLGKKVTDEIFDKIEEMSKEEE